MALKRTPLKRKPMKRKKLTPIKTLRKKAWKVFADWIKKRDGYKCVTCSKQMSKGDPNCQAGHFIHGDALDFHAMNINCQCSRCNKFLHGNGVDYTLFMIKEYGTDVIDFLKQEKRKVKKFTREDLEWIIAEYKEEE